MLLGQGPTINRCPRWRGQGPMIKRCSRWRGQGPMINRCPRVMMLMMSGRRPDIRRINLLGLRAGPPRWGWRSGPLPTLTTPRWVTSPRRLVTSLRSATVISVTTFTTVWSVAIWYLGSGRAVGPPQIHSMKLSYSTSCVTGSGRPVILDEVAVFPLFAESCCRDDPSSLFLTSGACSPSSGAWSSIESSMVSWTLLAAAAALRFCFCLNAYQASGSQSLQTSHDDSWAQSVKPSLRRHCWHLWWLSLRLLKWEQPGNFSCGSVDEDRSRDSAILLWCQKQATFHTSRNKVEFKANATSKASTPATDWRAR